MDVVKAVDAGACEHRQIGAPVVVPHDVENIGRFPFLTILAQERDQEFLEEVALLDHRGVRGQIAPRMTERTRSLRASVKASA